MSGELLERDSVIKAVTARFLRLNIAKKMLLGYLSVSLIVILIAVFALSSIERMNRINDSIMNIDLPVMNATDKMSESLLAQELYGRRYIILQSPDMLKLFWKRSEEFDHFVEEMDAMKLRDFQVSRIAALHDEYNRLFEEGFKRRGDASKKYDAALKKKQQELGAVIEELSSKASSAQNDKTHKIAKIGVMAFRTAVILCGLGIFFGIGTAIIITRNIAGSINKLKLATRQISEGNFDNVPGVKSHDELGELSNAFNEMAKRLKKLEEMYLDASPLTRLPGGVAIENVVRKRLEAASPLAFCLADLDNFKVFNDRYGYAKGSELIRETANIISQAVSENGTEDDFIGHIGGDDFVIVTMPERYGAICKSIIQKFDAIIPDFYDQEDRQRGYVVGKTRQGQVMSFPIMTISIAVVTNQGRKPENYIQIGEIAAELKDYAKSIPGSTYVVDKRRGS